MPDDEGSKNPFVRFKQHVDAHIGSTWQGLTSLSTTPPSAAGPGEESPHSSSCKAAAAAAATAATTTTTGRGGIMSGLLYGDFGVDQEHFDMWHFWAAHSPYSPYNLADLPRPVPRGLPPSITTPFTYRDAFEDLLHASAGRPMLDLDTRARLKAGAGGRGRGRFSDRETPLSWLGRLNKMGVLTGRHNALGRGLFVHDVEARHRALAPAQEGAEGAAGVVAEALAREGASRRRRWQCQLREEEVDEEKEDVDADPFFSAPVGEEEEEFRNFRRRLNKHFQLVFGSLPREEEDQSASASAPASAPSSSSSSSSRPRDIKETRGGPDTEEDLYTTLSSITAQAEAALSLGAKFVVDSLAGAVSSASSTSTSTSASSTSQPGRTTVFEQQGQPGKTVRSTEEYVDKIGFHHVKTLTRTFNENGEEIGREESHTVHSSPPKNMGEGSKNPERDENDRPHRDKGEERTNGWFWK